MTRAVGLCHSDLHVIDGVLARRTPIVLGHEAAGVVAEVGRGAGARRRRPASWPAGRPLRAYAVAAADGFALCADRAATARADQPSRLRRGSTPIHQFTNVGALAEEMILHRTPSWWCPRRCPGARRCSDVPWRPVSASSTASPGCDTATPWRWSVAAAWG